MSFENLLPQDGGAFLRPNFLNESDCTRYFNSLLHEIQWQQKPIKIFGKTIMQPRLMAWHGDSEANYKYSGLMLTPSPWTETLLEIKNKIDSITNHSFNSVLLNLYRDNNDSMGMHSDDEPELGREPVIASLSIGETREFRFAHKQEKAMQVNLKLNNGSLLIMNGLTQKKWKHGLPKTKKPVGPRINLTFRKIISL